jgi:outer membrane protein assembly factor BamA
MKRTSFLLLTAFVLFSATQPAAAQTRFLPKTIHFKGAPEYSDQELMTAAGLKKDTSIAYSELKGHVQKLLDTGLFESSNYTFNGVELVFNMVPSTVLYSLRLENLPLTPGKELDAALHDRLPLYHGKVPFDGGLTEQVRQAFEEMLAAKGIKATVAATPYTDLKLHTVTAMSFAITYPPVRVGEIQLEGVSPEMQAKAEAVASRAKIEYSTENSVANIEQAFTLFYSDEGYAAIKVHAVETGNPATGGATIEIPFHVTVTEGRHYALGTIYLPSGEPLTQAEINKAAGIQSTKTEKLTVKFGVSLRSAIAYVTGQYKSKGYMDCVVTPRADFDEAAGKVNYKLEVDLGHVYAMGNLTIQNSAGDLRAAMLAAWKMPEGAVFNESAISDYFYKQGDTPLGRTFASVNCKYKLTTDHVTHTVDVTLRLERKN